MAYVTPFLAKISGKFTVNVPNLMKSEGEWVGSQVWVNCPKFIGFFSLLFPLIYKLVVTRCSLLIFATILEYG